MVLLVQPRPIMLAERKPVAPSLLSDPAFSTDPYAHPFAVTSHEPWLSSPPAGHPSLKNKSRRRRPADDVDTESLHIIPPPNSPVNFADGPQISKSFTVPNDVLDPHSQSTSSLTTAAELSKAEPSRLSPAPPPSPPTARPPATPKRRITLMTILKRRSTQQPQSSTSANSKPRKALTSSKSLFNRSDVTRPDTKSSPVYNDPRRPATLGTSTPATVPMPSTVHPTPKRRVTDTPANRQENLDRIDELDETNPWGIGFHHGGPYEAAVPAIRGKEKTIFPGYGSYNRGVPQSDDNNYSPPQATGFSLNLSPGQVLPRNYQPRHALPSQPVQNSPAPPTAVMMKPPASAQSRPPMMVPQMQSSATLPASSRRQSYQTFSNAPSLSRDLQPRRQSLNPAPTTSQVNLYTPSPLSSSTTFPQPQQPQRFPPPAASTAVINPQPVLPSIPVETHHNPPNRVTGDPLSPVNLVSIGIGMTMLDDDSDQDEESSSSASSQSSTAPDEDKRPQPKGLSHSNQPVLLKSLPERTQPEMSRIVTTPQEGTSSSASSASLVTPPRKATLEEMFNLPPESPPPYSSPFKEVEPKEFGYMQAGVPSQPSSTTSSTSSSQLASRHANSQVAFVPTQAPSQIPSVQNQPPFRSDVPRSYPLSRHSPEHVSLEDSMSVHPSVSSKSSSSRSSGPPSSRRVPKRLVMPAPLAQSGVASPQYQNRPPLAQLPPQRLTRQSLPHHSPHPALLAQAQEIHFAPSKAGKLKKRVSLMGSASQLGDPPVVTTVSFAPPIIGFNNSVAKEEDFGPVVTEKLVQKRVLSKRKSNW